MAGRPPAVSDYEVVRAVKQALDSSGDPVVTTGEVANRLSIKREGTGRRLNELADRGVLVRKQVGKSYTWWLSDETKAVLRSLEQNRPSGREATGSSSRLSFEELLKTVFGVGQEQFGLEVGAIARVDPDADRFEVEYTSGSNLHFEPGLVLPLSETYCTEPVTTKGPASVSDPTEQGLENRTVHDEFGMQTYLGTTITPDNGPDRTFFFISSEPRDEPFTETEQALHDLMGQRLKQEFEQQYLSN